MAGRPFTCESVSDGAAAAMVLPTPHSLVRRRSMTGEKFSSRTLLDNVDLHDDDGDGDDDGSGSGSGGQGAFHSASGEKQLSDDDSTLHQHQQQQQREVTEDLGDLTHDDLAADSTR